MTHPQPPVSPTQADRDAALSTVNDDSSHAAYMMCDAIASGRADDWPLVQAFARHRLSAIAPGGVDRDWVLALRAAAQEAVDDSPRAAGLVDGCSGFGPIKKLADLLAAAPLTPQAPAGGEASERDLARDDAETFGIGFEVDGKQVNPSRVVVHYPAKPIELAEQHRAPAAPVATERLREALDFDAIAAEMDPYIAKWKVERPFTGEILRSAFRHSKGEIRSTAVCAIDAFHGFTCEFSPAPGQHVSEYDTLDGLLRNATALAEPAPVGDLRAGEA